jgi:hypothetical protein
MQIIRDTDDRLIKLIINLKFQLIKKIGEDHHKPGIALLTSATNKLKEDFT